MSRPIIRIHDLSTNKIIDREMTEQEYEDFINPKVEPSPTAHLADGSES
jgi:hypothetical protein